MESVRIQALGWAHIDACYELDMGRNPRLINISNMLQRARNDLNK